MRGEKTTNEFDVFIIGTGTAGMVGFGLLPVGFFWSAASPAAAMPVGDATRRLITGFFFARGATLRKISIRDASRYIVTQLTGGILGWIYLLAPVVGAQAGALIYRVIPWGRHVLCCKLIHD